MLTNSRTSEGERKVFRINKKVDERMQEDNFERIRALVLLSILIPPPLLLEEDERHPKFNEKFNSIEGMLPNGESLKNVIDRLKPFWKKYINNILHNKGDHLIVAHSNSLRAIVKVLDRLSDKEIISVNIPTGVPLLYTLNPDLSVVSKEYLLNEKELKAKQELILNQGKVV